MGYICCDSHLYETDETWSYMEPAERFYKPLKVEYTEPLFPNASPRRLWLVMDTWTGCFSGDGNVRGNMNTYDGGATHLMNPATRIEDLNALGIDWQLLIDTFFISTEIDNPLAEAALMRSYNRWAAEITHDCRDRFGWTLVAPTRMMDRALAELEFGAAHGAAGVHLKGVDHSYYLSDPYLYPLYEKAQDLGIVIVVHVGTEARRLPNHHIGSTVPTPAAFIPHVATLMTGMQAVIGVDLHKRFPRLKWFFAEGGCTWVPAVLQQYARLAASQADEGTRGVGNLAVQPVPEGLLAEKNIFIACEADEDLAYLGSKLGEEVLVAATDYAHNDLGTDLAAHTLIANRPDVPTSLAQKILDDNGRRLFGIDPSFRPADAFGRQNPVHVTSAVAAAAGALRN